MGQKSNSSASENKEKHTMSSEVGSVTDMKQQQQQQQEQQQQQQEQQQLQQQQEQHCSQIKEEADPSSLVSKMESMGSDVPPPTDHDEIIKQELRNNFGKPLTKVKCKQNGRNFKDDLDKICPAQKNAVRRILQQDFFEVSDISAVDCKQRVSEQMADLNEMNWQYKVLQPNGREIPINDYESMIIVLFMKNIQKDSKSPKLLKLPSLKMAINLYSSVNMKDGKIKVILKAKDNNRYDRARPEQTDKASAQNFIIEPTNQKTSAFAEESGAFGKLWAEKINGKKLSYPSFNQMMEGIFKWYHQQQVLEVQDLPQAEALKIIKEYKETFNKLTQMGKIPEADEPFFEGWKDYKNARNLWNPYNRIVCFCLYLYSLEFGQPPLYAELNRVSRDMDLNYLETLGPYARCMVTITLAVEQCRNDDDKILNGETLFRKGKAGYSHMECVFLLFRGAQMKPEWIAPYQDNIYTVQNDQGEPTFVYIPGNSSTSQNLKVALEFATQQPKEGHHAVLFVFACQNFLSPDGVRLNNEAYSAYPCEQEFLLKEGCQVYVLGVEHDVLINNPRPNWKEFNGKNITIIHLFHQV